LLLFAHAENHRLLAETLRGQGHEPVWPDEPLGSRQTERLLASRYDLCILDAPALERLADQVRSCRQAAAPRFVPFLLVSPRRDPATVARYLPHTVDEWLSTPVQKVELMARVDTLLRLGRLSWEAVEKARLEGALLAARTFEHEVNNKLVATAGYTERLAADPALPAQQRQRASRAHETAREAAAIIRQVLSLTERATLPVTDWGAAGETTIDLSAA
jgi:DNA-binding response OmpR family regulator